MPGWLFPGIILAGSLASILGEDIPWYQNAVIYQIYPRSFLDLDKDGIGDLKGIQKKVDYLESLGISAVWLSPIYHSPNEDFGYDISDYMDVNPEYGTLQDFVNLVKTLKEKGIRVLLDFVPNHSSTQHRWFVNSEANNETYSDFYVWRDAKGTDADNKPLPPNNWLSAKNCGSAWKWSEKRKQFYLHAFFEQEADLNYENPNVHQKMKDILEFWMGQGVDGFRVDSISYIYEDQGFKDEPKYKPDSPNNYDNLNHIYTRDLPKDITFVQKIKEIVDNYTKSKNETSKRLIILESYSPIEELLPYYGNKNNPGGIPFNFLLFNLNPEHSSKEWENAITSYYKAIGDHEPNWVLGNHDVRRVANRWSDDWVDLLHIIMMTLKGTAITYYGEEIGLGDNIIRWDQLKDLQGILAGKDKYQKRSRDFERAPFPWDDSHLGGFTQAPTTWIPLAPTYWKINVKAQESNNASHLKVYRSLTKLRKEDVFVSGDCTVYGTDDNIFYIFRSLNDRPTYISVINMGDATVNANLKSFRSDFPEQLNLLIYSINYPHTNETQVDVKNVRLPPKTGLVLSTSR